MARPKINLSSEVPKKEEESNTEASAPVAESVQVPAYVPNKTLLLDPPEFTHEALGLCKNKFDEWVVVSLKYDPKTRQVNPVIEEVSILSDKILAFERMKVLTIERGIF